MNYSDSMFDELKADGRPVVGCFPLYPPLELLHSFGLNPVVLWNLGSNFERTPESDRRVQTYVCSVGRRLMEFALSDCGAALDAIFFYNACDTLRNLPEIISRGLSESGRKILFFNFHIPMATINKNRIDEYLGNEIANLIKRLEATFGKKFSSDAFLESAALFGKVRKLMSDAESLVAERQLSFQDCAAGSITANFLPVEKQIEAFENLIANAAGINKSASTDYRRIIVSGILPPPPGVIQAFEDAGLVVAANDIASMRRAYSYVPAPTGDAAAYYADFYANHFPCSTLLHTADDRIGRLAALAADCRADGFIFIGEKFCEYEYFEYHFLQKRLKAFAGVSSLALEISIDDTRSAAAYKTRVDAFSEMLKG